MAFTILLVDDDAGFRRVARRLLTRRGFDVVADADTGAAAIEAVHSHRPDGVLLDVHLPDRDGLAVTRLLADLSEAPVVVLTSSEVIPSSDAALAACGARAFVAKDRLGEVDLPGLFRARHDPVGPPRRPPGPRSTGAT